MSLEAPDTPLEWFSSSWHALIFCELSCSTGKQEELLQQDDMTSTTLSLEIYQSYLEEITSWINPIE